MGRQRVRPRRRSRLRQEDRRRHAGGGAGQRGRHSRLSRSRRMSGATASAPGALLDVRGLAAQYGPTRVLHGIDFSVAEGGITAILGANGAGKSTLLRAVCNMIRTSGEVRLAGERIDGQATEAIVRRGVAHVPDGRGTFMN